MESVIATSEDNIITGNSSGIMMENLCESLPLLSKKEESLSHTLDEYPFDIEIEKKFLDTYALRNEDPQKMIKVRNYNVTNAETCKNVISKAMNKVVYQSESTNEANSTNYADDLKYLISSKEDVNKLINTKPDLAIEGYLRIIREMDSVFRTVKDERLFETDSNLRELENQKKLVMSNLALAYTKKGMYRDAIDLDQKIIYIDPKFDKSYARLITSYIKLDNIYPAQQYAERLRSFDHGVVSKYENILSQYDEAVKKADERSGLRGLYKKSKKMEETAIKKEELKKEEEAKQQIARKQSKKFSWFGAFFGGVVFMGSSAGLFFLYKFRKNFMI